MKAKALLDKDKSTCQILHCKWLSFFLKKTAFKKHLRNGKLLALLQHHTRLTLSNDAQLCRPFFSSTHHGIKVKR